MSTNRYRPPFMPQTSRDEQLRRQAMMNAAGAQLRRNEEMLRRPAPLDVIDLIEVGGVWMTREDAARR